GAADPQSGRVSAQPRPIAHPFESARWRLGVARAGATPDGAVDPRRSRLAALSAVARGRRLGDSTGARAGRPLLIAFDFVQQSRELRVTCLVVVRTLALDCLRERGDRWRTQKIRQRDVDAQLLPHACEHAHGEQRVAASREKPFINAEAIVTEQLTP